MCVFLFTVAQVGKISSLREFDREVKKYYDMPIEMADSGKPQMKGINYLRIEIGDINDNKHGPGAKEILVYNYKGLLLSSFSILKKQAF